MSALQRLPKRFFYFLFSLLGNFSHFWIKKDYSLFRLQRMMFRLNFLVVMVMAVARNEFVRYYVCAMHTYWFITVYVMLAVFKSHNEVNKFLFLVNKHDYSVPVASMKNVDPFKSKKTLQIGGIIISCNISLFFRFIVLVT